MKHENKGSCAHEHNDHSNLSVILYFVGLFIFILALFIQNGILKNVLFMIALLASGYHVLLEGFQDTIHKTKHNHKFTPNIHLLMGLAALGAMLIGNFQEAALLILIFAGAHFLEHYVEDRSKREITNLLNLNPKEGRLVQEDGTVEIVTADSLKIGDFVQVLNGDQIPTDGVITKGMGAIDESSITGESIPKEKTVNDIVFGSTMNNHGDFIMKVTKNPEDTVFSKILALVSESQSNLSETATKIKRYEPIYVKTILLLFPLYILLGHFLLQWGWNLAFYRGMVFLTVTSPCALAVSDVPATLSAISSLARHGVLFKGGSYLSNLSEIHAVAFDKTGTLTQGKPSVTNVEFKSTDNQDKYIQLIVSMEAKSNHPLADAILDHFNNITTLDIEVENIIGTGLVSTYENITYTIGKPTIFNDSHFDTLKDTYSNEGKTVVYFGTEDEVIAIIAMMDLAHDNIKEVIHYLNENNIETMMITGDSKNTANAIAKNLDIKNVAAEIAPEDKSNLVKSLSQRYGMVAMIGDGINDAPALVNADIGVAMGDGTDIAIDVADVVLMKNDLSNFVYAHKKSKTLKKIVNQNILFSMGVVVLLVVLNTLGQMNLPLGVVFHEGSTVLVILNGLRLLKK